MYKFSGWVAISGTAASLGKCVDQVIKKDFKKQNYSESASRSWYLLTGGNGGALLGLMSGPSWFCSGGGKLLSICCCMWGGTDWKICCCMGGGMLRNTGSGGILYWGAGAEADCDCGWGSSAGPALLDGGTVLAVVELGTVAGAFTSPATAACWDVLASKLAMAGGSCVWVCALPGELVLIVLYESYRISLPRPVSYKHIIYKLIYTLHLILNLQVSFNDNLFHSNSYLELCGEQQQNCSQTSFRTVKTVTSADSALNYVLRQGFLITSTCNRHPWELWGALNKFINWLIPRLHDEANMKQMYPKYTTFTTCALSLLHRVNRV